MQELVGIVRVESEMRTALERLQMLRARANKVGVVGNREYNPGWHTAMDLPNLIDISEAIARAALERRESRGGHFRDDYPEKDPAFGAFNIVLTRRADGGMDLTRQPVTPLPTELQQIIEEQKT